MAGIQIQIVVHEIETARSIFEWMARDNHFLICSVYGFTDRIAMEIHGEKEPNFLAKFPSSVRNIALQGEA